VKSLVRNPTEEGKAPTWSPPRREAPLFLREAPGGLGAEPLVWSPPAAL